MKTIFIHPAQALSSWLSSGLDRCNQALFTVAYLSEEGVETFAEALGGRLKRKSALVRILFQDHGFRTDPAAIRALQEVAKDEPGTLKLRFAGPDLIGLHAKAYGFKKGKGELEVILGSSNIGGKALGTDSGELNVRLGGVAATEAWAAMEDYWDAGYAVTPRWLDRYAKAHAKHKKATAKADAMAKKWKGTRRRTVNAADLWGGGVFVIHTHPRSREETKVVERRVKATRTSGVEVPPDYVTYQSRAEALADANKERALVVQRRAIDDPARGLSYLQFVRCGRALRVGNERLGTQWVVPQRRIRGTTIHFKRAQLEAVEGVLRRRGYEYDSLDSLDGRLRKRAKVMKSIYVALKHLTVKGRQKRA